MNVINAFRDGNTIKALYRDDKSQLRVKTIPATNTAFVRVSDFPDQPRNRNITSATMVGDYWRLEFAPGTYDRRLGRFVDNREQWCRSIERSGVPTYEGDLNPVTRWLVDNEITIGKPRMVYFDIETDSRQSFDAQKNGDAAILCWSLVWPDGSHKSAVLKEHTDEAEVELLGALVDALDAVDCITGWNVCGYDQHVVLARLKKLGVSVKDIRRWTWVDQLDVYKKYNTASSDSGEEKASFKLESVAQYLLSEGKHDVDASQAYELWESDPDKLVKYCIQDTDLCRRIEEKTGYLALFQSVCEITGCIPTNRSLKPTVNVESAILRIGAKRGVRFPSRWYEDDAPQQEKFEGAFVQKPVPGAGILENVHVADFASLYPSVLITFNLGADVKVGPEFTGPVVVSPGTGVRCRADVTSVVAEFLKTALAARKQWSSLKDSLPPGTEESRDAGRKSNTYKLLANATYGVIGCSFSRLFDREIAESVTLNSQFLIKSTIAAAQERGYTTVYGDTDSVFVTGPTESQFAAFTEWCNTTLYPQITADAGCVENRVKLAFEKSFRRLFFCAAKRYVGVYSHYKGTRATADSKPEVRGIELKRGDAHRFTREFQQAIVDLFADPTKSSIDYEQLVLEYRRRIIDDPIELADVVVSKAISRPLSEYKTRKRKDGGESDPGHVAIAKMMKERGQDVAVGTRIRYVVIDGSTSPMTIIPAEEFDGTCDRHNLWEVVFPAAQRLLVAMFPRNDWACYERSRPNRNHPGHRQIQMFGAVSF